MPTTGCGDTGSPAASVHGASDDRSHAWVAAHDFAAFTGFTLADATRFRASVLAARALDHWQADQYINFGLCGLAVPLKDRKGRCHYALSTTVQRQMYPDDQLVKMLLPVLREVAEALRPII